MEKLLLDVHSLLTFIVQLIGQLHNFQFSTLCFSISYVCIHSTTICLLIFFISSQLLAGKCDKTTIFTLKLELICILPDLFAVKLFQ